MKAAAVVTLKRLDDGVELIARVGSPGQRVTLWLDSLSALTLADELTRFCEQPTSLRRGP